MMIIYRVSPRISLFLFYAPIMIKLCYFWLCLLILIHCSSIFVRLLFHRTRHSIFSNVLSFSVQGYSAILPCHRYYINFAYAVPFLLMKDKHPWLISFLNWIYRKTPTPQTLRGNKIGLSWGGGGWIAGLDVEFKLCG